MTNQLVADLAQAPTRVDCEPWKIRPDDADAKILVGQNLARVRGTLSTHGFETTLSDAPVRDGFEGVLEVSR